MGIANLLSIPQLEEEGYVVDYNTERNWVVTSPKGNKITFKKGTGMYHGMPYINLRENHKGFQMIETVRKNFEGFTKRQVEEAILARKIQAMVAHPTNEVFKQMVSSKSLKNSKVTVEAISNARAIFGPNRPGLKGKTTRKKPSRVVPDYLGIPLEIYRANWYVTLGADVMFVNGLAFLVTLSRGIRLYTTEHLPSRTAKQLDRCLKK